MITKLRSGGIRSKHSSVRAGVSAPAVATSLLKHSLPIARQLVHRERVAAPRWRYCSHPGDCVARPAKAGSPPAPFSLSASPAFLPAMLSFPAPPVSKKRRRPCSRFAPRRIPGREFDRADERSNRREDTDARRHIGQVKQRQFCEHQDQES